MQKKADWCMTQIISQLSVEYAIRSSAYVIDLDGFGGRRHDRLLPQLMFGKL
jgi:hypothetical protein